MAASFVLSVRARGQLLDIYAFTAEKFGVYQAEAYHAGFERTFDLIANFPLIGVAVDDIARGLKRFRFQAHHVFYTVDGERVLIRAIFHAAMTIRPQLFE